MTARPFLSMTLAGLCLLAGGAAALAANESREISTAAAHASMAAGADQLPVVHAHLHHVVNCLVGPGGTGYDSSQEDPCKGQGAGAIPDASAGQKPHLESALSLAQDGLAATDLATAKARAAAAAKMLRKAGK